jgi:hypothetical protein
MDLGELLWGFRTVEGTEPKLRDSALAVPPYCTGLLIE